MDRIKGYESVPESAHLANELITHLTCNMKQVVTDFRDGSLPELLLKAEQETTEAVLDHIKQYVRVTKIKSDNPIETSVVASLNMPVIQNQEIKDLRFKLDMAKICLEAERLANHHLHARCRFLELPLWKKWFGKFKGKSEGLYYE